MMVINSSKAVIDRGGRIVIPASYRKALGIQPGDEVLLMLDDAELRVMSTHRAIARVQESVRKYVPGGTSLSDELIRERREEASRD